MAPFFQVTLRTSAVDAARRFYEAILGGQSLDVVKLHEQAVARGALPHWLGFIEVGDVDRATAAFVERGAAPLGAKWVNPVGLEASVIRDPGGALVALAKPPPGDAAPRLGPQVAWCALNTSDPARAQANYGALFGWAFGPTEELERLGPFVPFAWKTGGPPVGSVSGLEGRPNVHPHWLFHFRVGELGAALDVVRAGRGTVLGPFTGPGGGQLAVCEDPQGAAFGLFQAARP